MILQRLLILCLTFALTVSSGVMHVRAAQGPAVAQVVLCINGMTQQVWVDADGTPTAPNTSCPHCILAVAVTPDVALTMAPALLLPATPQPVQARSLTQSVPQTPRARAPPVLV